MKAEPPFALPLSRASAYFHIPYCARKCAYCDFHSVPLPEGAAEARGALRALLDAEIRQFDFYLDHWRPAGIPTLYIGGGTPSLIPPEILERFLGEITRRLGSPPEEFTIEANPESLGGEFLDVCASAGIGRLSLGIQSFDPRCLQTLGRHAKPEDSRRALRLLGLHWKGETSLDLMYGIPGQTSRGALADAGEALEQGPGHLSLYALTPEEGTPLHSRMQAGSTPALDEARQESIRNKVHDFLLGRGYENYEISSYALPGKRCRHNAAYWNLKPYMGIGPSAVSTLPGSAGPLRLSGPRDIGIYTRDPCRPETEALSARDFMADYILLGLRSSGGIDPRAFFRIFGIDFRDTFSRTVRKNRRFVAKNAENPGAFALTAKGRRVLNPILVDFFLELDRLDYTQMPVWPMGGNS
ncbi:MAG: coproporphyrinogen III oxidase family protein [Spirochaetia bacterium]|jgi:oxygen-independent coproporphyrinogen-3 oxidase|nr:coproporphyrinogen III oxidase family protein [Spirochaetia bacterium]